MSDIVVICLCVAFVVPVSIVSVGLAFRAARFDDDIKYTAKVSYEATKWPWYRISYEAEFEDTEEVMEATERWCQAGTEKHMEALIERAEKAQKQLDEVGAL